MQYLSWLNTAAGAQIEVSSATPVIKLLAVLGVLLVLLPRGFPYKHTGLILVLPLFFYQPAKIPPGDLELTVLDVGQGLSVLVQSRNYVLLYDLGPQLGEDFDAVSAVLLPFLNQRQISHIDHLVVSHGDSDHSGGLLKLLSQRPVRSLSYGQTLPHLAQLPVVQQPQFLSYCRRGARWYRDGIEFAFINAAQLSGSSNNQSCVLKITAGQTSILIPGDIEQSVETELVNTVGEQLAADILLAPHHGSNTSSSWPFIKAVSPQYVIYSAGYKNRFAHPSVSVQRRYQLLGVHSLNSSASGAITFTVQQGRLLAPQTYREISQRFWR